MGLNGNSERFFLLECRITRESLWACSGAASELV